MLKFTADHEWLRLEGEDTVVVGITAHAAEQLGDVVFVGLPDVGASFGEGDEMVVIESVKAASGIAAPFAGEVAAVNEAVGEDPALVNADPMANWFVKLRVKGAAKAISGFMDEAAYNAMVG